MSKRKLSPAWEHIQQELNRFPNTPSLTLAKKVMKDAPELFTTVEQARSAIRYLRGSGGRKSKKHLDPKLSRPFDPSMFNPFGLPETDEVEFLPFILPEECTKILFISDIHIPYHNISALTTALDKGIRERVDTVFIGGDFLDFYSLSSFERDPRRRSFSDELETGKEVLKIIKREFPDARIFYQIGNHEERFERYMRIKAPELLDVDEFRIDRLLEFDKLDITLISGKRIAKAGKLSILHGHEFGRGGASSSVNPARGLFNKAKTSAICGHHHQTSENNERDLNGKMITTWSCGCLCELSPDYMPINRWNHGFAIIEIDHHSGWFRVDNHRIIDGELI